MRRVWQKRRCRITADGFLDIYHADESKTPTRVNLLTCQIKPVAEEKRGFDLISCEWRFCRSRQMNCCLIVDSNLFADNRPYHFQAEDEADQKSWVAVLINCKEKALTKTFQHTNPQISPSLIELQKTLIRYVELLPGNDQCCDCSSKNGMSPSHKDAQWRLLIHFPFIFQTSPGLVWISGFWCAFNALASIATWASITHAYRVWLSTT